MASEEKSSNPGASAAPGSIGTAGGRSTAYPRHSRRSRSHERYHKLRFTSWILAAALAITTMGWILTGIKLSVVGSAHSELAANRHQQEVKNEQLTAEIDRYKAEIKTLVEGRIPGLQTLDLDTTVQLDQEYFRNISFTLTGIGQNVKYEYRVVLENETLNIVHPDVTIYLFDAVGIQVGLTRLAKENATSSVEFEDLQPGETRSYSGQVPVERDAKPVYFLVHVQ